MSYVAIARQWMSQRLAAGRRAENSLGWWSSLDAAWLAIAVSGLFLLATIGAVLATVQGVHGVFDGPVIRPAPDPRILANVRGSTSPFVDAAIVAGDDALFAARKNGTVHRLALSSHLWSEEQFDPAGLFTSTIAILQPGCGYTVANPACADPDTLYAVTEAGGIAVRRRGAWRMLVGDNSFEGLDGKPVAQSAMLSMAPVAGGRFLVFGTDRQGIGVFDTGEKRWIGVPADVQARIFAATGEAAPRVVRLMADARDRVWVGTDRGVGILSGLTGRLEGARVERLAGETLDMLPEQDGGMLVLGIERCPGPRSETGGACTALRRVDRRGTRVETVAGETERNDFNETDIGHVAVVAGRVRAFGSKGVYDYLEERRRFELVCNGEVTAIWQGTSGGPIVYAQNQNRAGRGPGCHKGPPEEENSAGTVVTALEPATGTQASWKIADERIDHIALGGDGRPWLLTRGDSNRVFVLGDDGPREIADSSQVPASSPLLLDPATVAVEVEGRILFVGASGAALHDPAARTFRFVDRAHRPEDLLAPGARLLAAENVVWIVSRESWLGAVKVYGGSTAVLEAAPRWSAASAQTRFTSAQVTAKGLLLTTSDGGFYLANVTRENAIQVTPVLGGAPSRPLGPLVDAAAGPNGVVVADRTGIFRYDARRRGWSGPTGSPKGEFVAGLAQADSGVFVLGSGGSALDEHSGLRLFGDGAPFSFGRSEVTDAWFAAPRLYLAAAGHVAAYDLPHRRHTDQWDLPAGALKIAGVVNGEPVVWDRQGAWHGRSRLMVDDGTRVTSASVAGDRIITVQHDDHGTFLAEFTGHGGSPRCLFRETEAGQGPMLDARMAGDAATAVLGADRLRLYAASQRRWVPVAHVVTGPSARLARLGNHLAVYDRERLALLPLSGPQALQLPDSCSRQPASSAGMVTVLGRQVAIDEASARAARLGADGEITQWTASAPQFAPVLQPAGRGPPAADLKRVVSDGRLLRFATPDAVWSYDLDRRTWRHQRLDAAAPLNEPISPRSLSLMLTAQDLTVSVRDDRDRDFGAVVTDGADIRLTAITPGPPLRAPFDPARLIDAAELSPRQWLFLAEGRLAAFDAGAGTWTSTSSPALGAPGATLVRYGGGEGVVAVAEGDPARPARLVFPPLDLAKGGAAADSAASAPNNSFSPSPGERYAVVSAAGASRDRGAAIVRVLPDNEVRSCAIAGTGEVRPCETLLPAALTLPAGRLAAAVSFDGATLIATQHFWAHGELRLIDRLSRRALATPDLPDFDPAQATFYDVGHALWIRDRGGRIRALNRTGEVALIAADSTMIREIGGAVWIISGGLARRAGGDGKIEDAADILRRAGRADVTPKSFLPSADASIHVLTTAGEVFAIGRDGGLEQDGLDISTIFDPAEVQSAVMVAGGRAWIQHGPVLSLVAAGDCAAAPNSAPNPEAPRPQHRCARKVEDRPLPGTLARGSILRMVDGERFVFEQATLSFDSRSGDWRRIENAGGVGADLPAARNVRDALAAAVGDGGMLDVAVFGQDGTQITIGRPTLPDVAPLRFDGAMAGEPLPALGASGGEDRWLRYDRTARKFRVRSTHDGTIAVSAQELFPGGVFAPTLPGRSVMAGPREFVHANASGLWTFPLAHDWIDGGPVWTRIGLPPVATAARGRFYFDTGSIAVDGTRIEPDEQEYVVATDGLTIRENIRGESVAATIDVAGRPANALAAAGFQHDQRLAIAFDRSAVVIATPVGIVDARDLHATALPPGWGAIPPSDAALFDADGMLYAAAAGRFFRADAGRWSEVTGDPRQQPRTLASAGGRDFVRNGDAVAVKGDGWRTRLGGGWRFAADDLEGAAHTAAGAILAVTREGIVEAQDLDGLAAAGPPRRKPDGANGELERHFRAPGVPVTGFVYRDAAGKDRLSLVLNDASDFVVPPDDPLTSRVAVRQGLLSIAFRNNQAVVDAAAQRPDGGRAAIAVDWRKDEHFPFDRATAIAADGGTLYVGTEAGLIVTSAAAPAAQARLVDTGAGDHVPVRVDRIGRPASAPARLVARTATGCLDLGGGVIAPCTDPQVLNERWLGSTGYWRWTAKAAPEMVYLDSAGRAVGRPVTSLTNGFPHDHPAAAVDCPVGGRVSLWDDGLVVETAGSDGDRDAAFTGTFPVSGGWPLDGRSAVSDLRSYFHGAPATLHCQSAPLRLPGGTVVAPGVRALAPESGLTAIHDHGNWRTEPEAVATAVIARWRGAIPYDHARLRLIDRGALAGASEPKGVEFQYFTRAQQWRPLKVRGGRYLVDDRLDIVSAGGVAHVLTPEGLVRLASGGGYRFDPDTIDIIAVPCEVDRIETADGHGLALTAEPDAPTLVRCRDGTVLQGRLDGSSDGDVFVVRRPSDPFLERELVSTGATSWRIVDRKAGQPGRIDVVWRNERLPLSGGRFALDVWSSLARLRHSSFIEMASEQGWIRSPAAGPARGLPLGAVQRPPVPPGVAADVRKLAADMDSDHQAVLCLLDQNGQTAVERLAEKPRGGPDAFAPREPRDCGRFEGDEASHGPWTYRANIREPSPLTMRGEDRSGAPVDRAMSGGRFTDLVATGAPLSFAPRGEAHTLVPTPAGISQIAASGEEGPLRAAKGAAALALLVTGRGDPEVLTADGFDGGSALGRACPLAHKLGDLGAIRFAALGMSGDGVIEMSGRRGAEPVFYSVSCAAGDTAVMPWWLAIPVGGRRRVTANRLPWDRVWLNWTAGHLKAGAVTPSAARTLSAQDAAPLRFLDGGDRIFAVTTDDVLEIDVDALVSSLSRDR